MKKQSSFSFFSVTHISKSLWGKSLLMTGTTMYHTLLTQCLEGNAIDLLSLSCFQTVEEDWTKFFVSQQNVWTDMLPPTRQRPENCCLRLWFAQPWWESWGDGDWLGEPSSFSLCFLLWFSPDILHVRPIHFNATLVFSLRTTAFRTTVD